jgi:hypothetical protein
MAAIVQRLQIVFGCKKCVCSRYFTEHIDAAKAQIDLLVDEINSMIEKIQVLTIEQIMGKSFSEFHQWKVNMYQLIDEIILRKTKEM